MYDHCLCTYMVIYLYIYTYACNVTCICVAYVHTCIHVYVSCMYSYIYICIYMPYVYHTTQTHNYCILPPLTIIDCLWWIWPQTRQLSISCTLQFKPLAATAFKGVSRHTHWEMYKEYIAVPRTCPHLPQEGTIARAI